MLDYFRQIKGFRRDIKLFLVYNLFASIGIGVFVLIYNLYLVRLSLREDFIGTYNAVNTLAMAVAALVMGPLIGRFGNWVCLTAGTALFVVSSVVLSLTAKPGVILVMSALAGAGAASVVVPIMPFIVEWARPEARAVAAAVTLSIQSLSGTFGSLVGGWSPRLFAALLGEPTESILAYRLTLLAGVALGAVALLPLWLMQEARGRRASETGQALIIQQLPATRRQIRTHILVFVAVGFIMSFGSGAVVPFYNVYLEHLGAAPSQIGMVFALAGGISAIIGLLAPAIEKRLGPLGADLTLRLMPVPAFLLLTVSPSLGIAVLAHMLRTSSIAVAWPINSTFISDLLPPHARANAFSIRSGLWNIGYALAALVAGQVIVSRGYAVPFIAFGLAQIASSALFFGYFRRHRKLPEPREKPVQPPRSAASS